MKRLLFVIFVTLYAATGILMAKKHVPIIDTGNKQLDSLLFAINKKHSIATDSILYHLSAQVYVKGNSSNLELNKYSRYLTNILPFEAHKDQTTVFETVCRVNYQNPCELQFTPIALRTNSKRGRNIAKESYQVLLPIYSLKRMNDKGSNKSYVIPYSDYGLEKYIFSTEIDTIDYLGAPHIVINYEPRHEHHTLGAGYFIADMNANVKAMLFSGRIDFGKVEYFVKFEWNDKFKLFLPVQNNATIGYNYAGNKGVNEITSYITFDDVTFTNKKDHKLNNLDLSNIYDIDYQNVSLDSIRPIALSKKEDSLFTTSHTSSLYNHKKLIQTLPEKLIGSSNINAFGNNLKVYGPLDPASFSYDKINGFTIRQRFRFSKLYPSGRSFLLKPDLGFSFKMKEFRYKISGEWIYSPRHRGGLKLTANNRSSEFSSKFQNDVNKVLSDTSNLKFEDLGIDYYRRNEVRLEHNIELANGLMFAAGASYNYRDPVRHGSRAMSQERIDELVDSYYADFNPYMRLTYTPRQYYHYQGNQKLYIASYYPTFTLEIGRSIKGVMKSTSEYTRAEFNIQQAIMFDNVRTFYYNIGAGSFFKQTGDYFISYTYFARSMFPSTWDDHIGGTFNLLNDYWYNSSPGYIQSHLMYETPFMLLHKARSISKYVIKERVYLSNLWADGKNSYSEIGYGMGNNYFNVGVFSSFIGVQLHEIGVKATIEIDSHW